MTTLTLALFAGCAQTEIPAQAQHDRPSESRLGDRISEPEPAEQAWELAVEGFFGRVPWWAKIGLPASGALQGEWMFPFESSQDGLVDEQTTVLLDSGYVCSSFTDDNLDAFFAAFAARQIAEILVNMNESSLQLGSVLEQQMLDQWHDPNSGDGLGIPAACHAVVDEYGEQTSDNQPFSDVYDSAGRADNTFMETVTTLPATYLLGADVDADGAWIPMYNIPLYQRYLTQHEFGHRVQRELADASVDVSFQTGPNDLWDLIEDLYEEAVAGQNLVSCYSATNHEEFWAEATAIYFAPIAIASLNTGEGNGVCGIGLSPEAHAVIGAGGAATSGAAMLEALQPNLAETLALVYGPAPSYTLR